MSFQGDSIFWVEVDKVVPNPFQPRREFNEERLQELADSIRMYGVLQPLTVTRREVHNDDGSFRTEYELIAGERRWRASRLAGVAQVPVIIRSGEQTEQEKLELAIIENLQREDLNAVDRALAFKQLAEAFNLSHAQVAKKVGRSREYVSNSIRLLALPENILDGLKRGDISEGHARTLLMLKDKPEEQDVLYREILLKKLSVREVERISRKIATDKVRKREYKDTDAHLIEIEREFTDTLGTRVQILKTDYGGKLTIDYFSEDDLGTLLEAMKKQHARISAAALDMQKPNQIDDSVGETVVREMDSAAVATLADSTPLASAEPEVPVADGVSDDEPNEPPLPEQTKEKFNPIDDVMPAEQTEVGEASIEVAKPEQTGEAEVASDNTDVLSQYKPTTKEHVAEKPLEPRKEPEKPAPETEKESAVPQRNDAQDTNTAHSDLRARLEAELARLEAEEKAQSDRAQTAEKQPEKVSDGDAPIKNKTVQDEASTSATDTDDNLYSIRNFNV